MCGINGIIVYYKSVKETMLSDVPIGTFLSGGIDSCIITGLVSNISKKQIDSFSIGFKEKEFDESKRAILSAKKHKVNHFGKLFRNALKNGLLKTLNKDRIVEQNIFNCEHKEKILNEHFSFKKDRTSEL